MVQSLVRISHTMSALGEMISESTLSGELTQMILLIKKI